MTNGGGRWPRTVAIIPRCAWICCGQAYAFLRSEHACVVYAQMEVLQDLALRLWHEYEWALSIAGLFSFIITDNSLVVQVE